MNELLSKHKRNVKLFAENASFVKENGLYGHMTFVSAMCIKHNESAMIAPLLGIIKGSGIPLLTTGAVSLVTVMKMVKYAAMANAIAYQVSIMLMKQYFLVLESNYVLYI